ncbi:hypothetical protein I7I50_03185 [Histoplasma capsulatum G186AR]|uniref:Uncharacterized protein n=1 Tax=Ajellomyces capsulatus TaxID=5037 RepID=A0A8H7Z468_AJECA|nr:hypothetical protein I7I52_00146 [Histoplasma capsulatum]QSS72119.1 hypothetical protein I7I50_03185 [Histoplasma capsulatum G186AR]
MKKFDVKRLLMRGLAKNALISQLLVLMDLACQQDNEYVYQVNKPSTLDVLGVGYMLFGYVENGHMLSNHTISGDTIQPLGATFSLL